jgi:hypothetical protein
MSLALLVVANKPYLKANDVGALLGYSQPAVAINKIFKNGFGCKSYKELILLGELEAADLNKLKTRYISEDGVYLLVSRLPFVDQQSILMTKIEKPDRLKQGAWFDYLKQVAACRTGSWSNRCREAIVRDRLAARISGSRVEVRCETGFVDIVTPDQIIEVKRARSYKAAIGQIIVYGLSFPTKTRRIHIFTDDKDPKEAAMWTKIESVCKTLDIAATFELLESVENH